MYASAPTCICLKFAKCICDNFATCICLKFATCIYHKFATCICLKFATCICLNFATCICFKLPNVFAQVAVVQRGRGHGCSISTHSERQSPGNGRLFACEDSINALHHSFSSLSHPKLGIAIDQEVHMTRCLGEGGLRGTYPHPQDPPYPSHPQDQLHMTRFVY